MIREQYVSFETARLLKECGFPQEEAYMAGCKVYSPSDTETPYVPGNYTNQLVSAPSQAVAMRWLREDRGLHIDIDLLHSRKNQYSSKIELNFVSVINPIDSKMKSVPGGSCKTYEQATETGIKTACEYILEKTPQI